MASTDYVTPPTIATSGAALSSDQNKLRDGILSAFGNKCEVVITRTANQTISSATQTSISFDAETTDTDGFFAPTSPTITIPGTKAGRYLITFYANGNSVGSTRAFVGMVANGVKFETGFTGHDDGCITVSTRMSASSTIQCYVFQQSGSSIGYTARLELERTAI